MCSGACISMKIINIRFCQPKRYIRYGFFLFVCLPYDTRIEERRRRKNCHILLSCSVSFDSVEPMLHKLFQCPAAFGIPTQFIVHFFFSSLCFSRLSNASVSYCLFGMELKAKNPHSEKLLTSTTTSATALNHTDFR